MPNQYSIQSHIGLNRNIEYSWSNNIEELIVQYYFQLIRGANYIKISTQLNYLLLYFQHLSPFQYSQIDNNFLMLYKLLLHTRDIYYGKGEYDLSYLQLCVWYKYFPRLAEHALATFVFYLGSWKDIKKLCGFINENGKLLSLKDNPPTESSFD